MAVLLLAAAGLAYFTLAPKSKAPRSFSIAVLPLTPLYEDASAQHLGDSIAASVADMLSGYGLDVVSPAKSFQFRGADKARANGALHADFIIDGEVRRERGNYLVAIRIVAGESGTTLLAENFERPVSQEADLPENIAGEVAELEWYVTTGFGRSALWDRRVMAGALRATHLLRTRADASAANDIARHLEEIAPDDPYAYAVHVRTALQMTADMPTGHKEAFLAEARRAAAKAVRLDPSYADGYALQAMTVPSIDWLEHDHAYKRALTIMPKAPIAYTLAVEFLQNTGRFKESVRLAEEAYAANPYLADINIKTANSRLWSGQTQLASDLIRRGSHLFSRGTWFPAKQFEAAAFYGAPGTAGALLQDASIKAVLDPADGPQVFAAVAAALKSQRPSDIDVVVKDCANPDDLSPAQERTCLLALSVLGRIDAAFKLTDALYPDQRGASAAERDRKWLTAPVLSTAYLLTPPAARLRADPRFLALVERIGLYGYWKAAHIRPDFCDSEKVAVCR
jgi:Predicted integral membrane protein